jgi:hypothetical protein
VLRLAWNLPSNDSAGLCSKPRNHNHRSTNHKPQTTNHHPRPAYLAPALGSPGSLPSRFLCQKQQLRAQLSWEDSTSDSTGWLKHLCSPPDSGESAHQCTCQASCS